MGYPDPELYPIHPRVRPHRVEKWRLEPETFATLETPTKAEMMEPPPQQNTKPQEIPAIADPPSQGEKLDLSQLSPPKPLEELRLEEVTIDGICGVY